MAERTLTGKDSKHLRADSRSAAADWSNRRGYVICGDARSGSTYLCHLLRSTRRLGVPRELFHDPGIVQQLQLDSLAFDAHVATASTANAVYGLKVFTPHFELAEKLRWIERLPNLHFVHLEREDLLGQALSLSRVLQTRQYKGDERAMSAPSYDRQLIADCIARISYGGARWRSFFARNDVVPLRLTYEAVVREPQAAVDAIAAYVGVTGPAIIDPRQVEVAPQRDELTEDWRGRFVDECGDLAYLDGGLLLSGRRGAGWVARFILGPGRRRRRYAAR